MFHGTGLMKVGYLVKTQPTNPHVVLSIRVCGCNIELMQIA
jgi:hypothetical protein